MSQDKKKFKNVADEIRYLEKKMLSLEAGIKKKKEKKAKIDNNITEQQLKDKLKYFGKPGYGKLGPYGTWGPNPKQKEIIEAFETGAFKLFTYTGGNRSGKTTIMVILIISIMIGCFPWELDDPEKQFWIWKKYKWKGPVSIKWIGSDWESHVKDVLVKNFNDLWPKSRPKTTRKNNMSAENYHKDDLTGSELKIYSNRQDPKTLEGGNCHALFWDEPPSQEVRIATMRGLTDYEGLEFYSCTLTKKDTHAFWFKDDVEEAKYKEGPRKGQLRDDYFHVKGTSYDNKNFGLSQEGIDQFKAALSADEIKVRIEGGDAFAAAKVLPDFDYKKHVIDRKEIPKDWLVDVAIDIGMSKEHDVLYLATSKAGYKYCCFEECIRGNGTIIGESIANKMNRYGLKINRVICDPLAKADKNQENTTWGKIDDVLYKYNLFLEAGSKQKSDGILSINELLNNFHGEPSLFFFRDMVRTIGQISSWGYDKDGKASKKDDDMCENLYRLALLETTWEDGEDQFNVNNKGSNLDPITGY